uniref:Rho guanine nucleotide exchange factor 49 n=1 Tax=Acanthochromis polyacanthus TaxID=80966 RepID=A0A3Q1EBZ2_9TELE
MEPCIANLSPDPLSSFPRHRPDLPPYPGPAFPLLARCSSSTLLSHLGLRCCPGQQGPLGLYSGQGSVPGSHTGSGGRRPYRSMENLNWSAVVDPGLCTLSAAPYRSVDSEFILRYASSSHWYDGPPDGALVGPHSPESLAFYPRLPRKDLPLFPQLLLPGGVDEWDARKGLREKLRLQSARSAVEPLKPLPLRPQVTLESMHNGNNGARPPCTMRITSPEEIKQEVLRRLQLRRQNSSPNLALHSSPCIPTAVRTSFTTDSIAGNKKEPDSASEHRRPPVGRLHIPTFEEFKKMRQREGSLETTTGKPDRSDKRTEWTSQLGSSGEQRGDPEEVEGGERTGSCSAEISAEAPVRLSGDRDGGCDITTSSTDCQPSAVAMATSATACGAEAGDEAPAGEGGGEGEETLSSLGCRRSSLDAAYELAETVRAQRECRLRPHYSDPMPADASKRKQLEMKIAAAARLHSHRRDRAAPAAIRGRSEPPGEERQAVLGVTRSGQHRWSTISSLSADSGVVGLSDERDEEDSEPRRYRRSRGAEVERVDSGIGPGLSRTWKRPSASLRAWEAQRPCPDCGLRDGASKERGERMCERCSKLRTERKEAILEFLNTESSYGEDLRIIKEEFYCPMQSAGLLTAEQLLVVFGNVQELIDVNDRFTEHLQDSIDQAFDQIQGDEDLLTVYIGEIFLEFVNMLPAFQTYCLQQSTSVNMLNTLEKEKELLIFLDVSQNDNTALRRMNLRSFLMAPLQRVTKYPLLLSRIIKVTPECHPDYSRLREAKSRVESHLEHINMKTKQEGNGVSWSLRSFRRDSRKNREVINIEMREVSMKTVGWARENTRFVMEGPLQLSQPADGQWVKKGSKALKFQNVQSLLMVRTQRSSEAPTQGTDSAARGDQVEGGGESIRDGVLVLIKDKSSGKFAVLREPIRLGNCVVSTDPDSEDTFEVLDIRRESFVFRASDKSRTQQWFHQIKRYARDLGTWRKRRNALPNIMINTNQTRS